MKEETITLLGGLGAGAALMYLLDPQQGRRRRALARDQMVRVASRSGKAVEPTLDDLGNRTRGMMHEMRKRVLDKEVDDEVLVRRVRAELGRYVSHPGSIGVTAQEHKVILHGPILEHEVERLLKAVRRVPGVKEVDNQMSLHKTPGNVPGLQGGDVPPALRENEWSPTARLLTGTAGGALTAVGARKGGLFGGLLGALGITALMRAISNVRLKRMFGVDAGRRAIDIQKTINVSAPPQDVYEYWANFENFPRFMSHLNEVKVLGDGRSRWVAEGPMGTEFSWEATITEHVPNRMIAWRTTPGAQVQNAGMVHFTPDAQGGTQIQVQMSYNPPAGAVGHSIADLLGTDPESAMDKDLARFKSLIEEGKTTAKGETVTRNEMKRPA
ncbi:MAG: SRPBCC family protein [Chloroflexota bacterium]